MPKSRLVSTVLNLIKLVERKVRLFFTITQQTLAKATNSETILDFKIFTEKNFRFSFPAMLRKMIKQIRTTQD